MPDLGHPPDLVWLPVDRLSVDPRYQRDTKSRRSQVVIEKIAADFRWSRFGVIMAVKGADGWLVVDGQHRVEAARRRSDVPRVPALVLRETSLADVAADFVAVNQTRVIVTPLHLHHAQLAAGDPETLKVADICKRAGIRICRWPTPANKMKPGETLAVGLIISVVRLGEDAALKILTRARKASPVGVSARAIRGAREELLEGKKLRPCLTCGTPFQSDGPHNRMCPECRRNA